MFSRSQKLGKPGAGFAVMKSEATEVLKYSKPRILLIDVKDDMDTVLKSAGYNVSSGSFGTPYRVPKNDEYRPVIPNGSLKDPEEQEIVVVDLAPNEPLDAPMGDKVVSPGEDDLWVKCTGGIVDPRPRIMAYHQSSFNRILHHGGVFIIFADSRENQQLVWAYFQSYLRGVRNAGLDNWSFLSVLSNVEVHDDKGHEIRVEEVDGNFLRLLSRHTREASFSCSLHVSYYELKNSWYPLARNKYDSPVAGIMVPNEKRKGYVIILPQLKKKSSFVSELVTSILPDMVPHLFPHIEGARWVEREEYEIASIRQLKTEKLRIQKEAQTKIQELDEQIRKERETFQYLHDLIGGQGRTLVEAVKQTLSLLGFKKVVDVDHEKEKDGESEKDEDLQIVDYSPLLLVEIKGIGGTPSDEDALGVAKHIAPSMKRLGRNDIHGLSIINHQRHIPALERENNRPFRDSVVTSAKKKHDVGLFTAWDLFRLARSFLRNNWSHEQVRDLFYQTGRIHPIASHYHLLGTIDEFWEKASALSVKTEDGILMKGDRVGYELPVEFVEEDVDSLQLDGKPVEQVSKSAIIGVKTTLKKEQAKRGVRVYRIITDSSRQATIETS